MHRKNLLFVLPLMIFAACNNAEHDAAMKELAATADSTVLSSDVDLLQSPSRKIVRTADITCRVEDVNKTVTQLEQMTRSLHGMIANSQTDNRVDEIKTLNYKTDSLKQVRVYTTSANLTLRVHVQYTDSVMALIPAMVSFVENRKLALEDKTFSYLSNALKNEALQKPVVNTPPKEVEGKIYEDRKKELAVDRKMENMQLLDDVHYATITVQLFQPAKTDEYIIVNPQQATTLPFGRQLVLAMQGGGELAKDIIIVCIQLWPLWMLLSLGIVLYRKMQKRKLSV